MVCDENHGSLDTDAISVLLSCLGQHHGTMFVLRTWHLMHGPCDLGIFSTWILRSGLVWMVNKTRDPGRMSLLFMRKVRHAQLMSILLSSVFFLYRISTANTCDEPSRSALSSVILPDLGRFRIPTLAEMRYRSAQPGPCIYVWKLSSAMRT